MDLKFSEMSVDTSLAQKYIEQNETLLEFHNDYDGTIKKYGACYFDGKVFTKNSIPKCPYYYEKTWHEGHQKIVLNMASKLKQNAALITQLEYYTRNIPIEVTSAQLNLIIQYFQSQYEPGDVGGSTYHSNDPLLACGGHMFNVCRGSALTCRSKEVAAICHLLITLLHEAGAKNVKLIFLKHDPCLHDMPSKIHPVNGLNSGTIAVVSDDADVDSAVDKFIAVSIQAPWRLKMILVQESVYQQFKDALSWKCKLNKSGSKSPTSDVLCSDAFTYNDKTFVIDPVEVAEKIPPRYVVTVEAYRTTKEMISLVQHYQARYLSLWTNGIAEINEVTHSTKAPVVWVNNIADFRGPPQVSEAVFSYLNGCMPIKKCDRVTELCKLSQSWLKLDLESRRDILCAFLDTCIQFYPANKRYPQLKKSLSTCTMKSFIDVGKDYVCMGMSQPKGFLGNSYDRDSFFSAETFELILKGNALIVFADEESSQSLTDYVALEQAGVPVACMDTPVGDFPILLSSHPTQARVVWTNSGTIFAN